MKKIIQFLFMFLWFSVSFALAADFKIGVVDIQKIIRESKAGQEARASFEGEVTGRRRLLAERDEALKKLRMEIDKGSLSETVKREKEERFQRDLKELKRLKDDTEEELREKDLELRKKLIAEILDVIKRFGEEGKYTVIIEKGQSVLYTQDAIDITNKVIEKYNAQKTKK